MSSHREAPEISKDPVADSTDLYAFVSPDEPNTVTIIANYVPLESPDGGPNFYEFGNDVLYEILIDNNGDSQADITYQFQFTTTLNSAQPTFLYNTGPIQSLTDPNWNRRQTYSVTKIGMDGHAHVLGTNIPCPPCNIGPLSTPNYLSLVNQAVTPLGNATVFAGQRAEGFYVDLGAVFDLGILRPFEGAHTNFGLGTILQNMPGVQSTASVNVHTIALKIPIRELTANHSRPRTVTDPHAVLGIWTTANRQKAVVLETPPGQNTVSGPFVQVSRLGNPLVNEVVIDMARKDYWNSQPPAGDAQFLARYTTPELAGLLPVLYPGVFPNLAAFNASGMPRNDLVAILLTGIPTGVVSGFQNFSGPVQADLLRLNVAVPPASNPSNLGLIGGDPAGYPNGRRVFDDVATIELRCIAGASLPLVDPSFTPDAAAGEISMGLTSGPTDLTAMGTENYLSSFPYLGTPYQGFEVPSVPA
jgi:hypothetical protein